MADDPAPDGSPRDAGISPVGVALVVLFAIGLIVAVPGHAQRIAQVEFVLAGLLAARLVIDRAFRAGRDPSGAHSRVALDPPAWTLRRSAVGVVLARLWTRVAPAGARRRAAMSVRARQRRGDAGGAGPIPDGLLRMGRHIHLMTVSDFNAVVHLRPTVLRLVEPVPGAGDDPALQPLLAMGSPWEARRDGGGLTAGQLDAIVTALEQHYAR